MQNHPLPVFLEINRAIIGARRAAWVYMACRYAAQKLDPSVRMQARYEDHERVGWTFYVKDSMTAMRLAICHAAVMQGRPLPLPR
ncbi:hypothetical protein [Belnapia rosea]|uniref:hypothetical protein n=1 Tax=Belnapia rosea TaxID=938405 RepID=UPI000B85E793|nr:hypothetical protein [Belnapia rosea]